jgi:pimeloyl-ACP methyl ester carboxylesterase
VPLGAIPTIERWMDDITTVIDAVGSTRIVPFGHGDGGPIAMLFAATYPQRTEALVLGDTFARIREAVDYPIGLSEAAAEAKAALLYSTWGRADGLPVRTGGAYRDSSAAWRARLERLALSPGALETMYPVCDLDPTEKASSLGDRAWSDLLARHHALVRRQIAHFRGREIATAGDGFLALFDGPARGVRCGLAICEAVRALGLEVRAGLHTGECERMGDNVGGIAVHIGARIVAEAAPGEVLASSTVRDLVVGSGLTFRDRGGRPLKGVEGEWRLFAAA